MLTIRKEDRNKTMILLNNERLTLTPTISKADQRRLYHAQLSSASKIKSRSCEILLKPDGTEWTSAIYEVRLLK